MASPHFSGTGNSTYNPDTSFVGGLNKIDDKTNTHAEDRIHQIKSGSSLESVLANKQAMRIIAATSTRPTDTRR
jgi:hypothetical protein